jgi:hypothetical protein
MADPGEDEGWTISIDPQWQNVTVRIPADGTARCLFASIASQSIVVYSIGAAGETDASAPADPIRLLPLPFKVVPENSSACYEDGVLVLGLSRR